MLATLRIQGLEVRGQPLPAGTEDTLLSTQETQERAQLSWPSPPGPSPARDAKSICRESPVDDQFPAQGQRHLSCAAWQLPGEGCSVPQPSPHIAALKRRWSSCARHERDPRTSVPSVSGWVRGPW